MRRLSHYASLEAELASMPLPPSKKAAAGYHRSLIPQKRPSHLPSNGVPNPTSPQKRPSLSPSEETQALGAQWQRHIWFALGLPPLAAVEGAALRLPRPEEVRAEGRLVQLLLREWRRLVLQDRAQRLAAPSEDAQQRNCGCLDKTRERTQSTSCFLKIMQSVDARKCCCTFAVLPCFPSY